MYTKKLSAFSEMVKVAKEQNLDYRILFSKRQRPYTAKGILNTYTLILCTSLFKVSFSKNDSEEPLTDIDNFVRNNHDKIVEVNSKIECDAKGNIELN